jgi:type II secretory pathway predicted ATPase ExeA
MRTATAERPVPFTTADKQEEVSYMPIHLKGVLARVGLTQEQWARAIVQKNGRWLSKTAATQILNWNVWPTKTSIENIKRQTEQLLRRHNVPATQIDAIWIEDSLDEHRSVKPAGLYAKNGHHRQPMKKPEHDIFNLEVQMLSAAAKKQFRIFKDPFVDDVQSSEDVFLSAEQRYIREAMYTTAKHGGFLAIVGESGSGKTTLRRDLLDRVAREQLNIVAIQPRVIDKGRLTAGLICEAIIRDLSQQKPRQSLEGKARQVEDILIGSSRAGNAHVLLIEEAHDLTVATLKYLKRFWELEDGFKKLLSIILIGQPELKGMLDERVNYEAREVIRRCEIAELMPLNSALEQYIELKFARIGRDTREVFKADAYDAMRARLTLRRRGSDGVVSMLYPLTVNNLVTKALNTAADLGIEKVDAEVINAI